MYYINRKNGKKITIHVQLLVESVLNIFKKTISYDQQKYGYFLKNICPIGGKDDCAAFIKYVNDAINNNEKTTIRR